MKKYGAFAIALLISMSIPLSAAAEKKKKTGIVKSFGVSVNKGVKKNINKNVRSGIYGKSTIDQAEEAAPKAVAPTPTPPPPPSLTTGEALNPVIIKKNQSKEELVATGILFFNGKNYEKAVGEFKKAQSVGNDPILQRWFDVTTNRQKIKEISLLIEEITGIKEKK